MFMDIAANPRQCKQEENTYEKSMTRRAWSKKVSLLKQQHFLGLHLLTSQKERGNNATLPDIVFVLNVLLQPGQC